MTSIDAMRILQHASFYIFSTRVVGGPGKTMRGTVDVWQAMATLDQCRNELLQASMEAPGTARSEEFKKPLFGRVRHTAIAAQMLCC